MKNKIYSLQSYIIYWIFFLIEAFNNFYFERFSFDSQNAKANFFYSFDKKVFFEEEIVFRDNITEKSYISDPDSREFHDILLNIHMALGLSYYKIYPTKNLYLESGYIEKTQVWFWEKFYKNWLGEFFVQNNIKPHGLCNFIILSEKNNEKIGKKQSWWNAWIDKSLLLLWGWKDSIVSYSLLQKRNFDLFVFGKSDKIKSAVANEIWKTPILVSRMLSDNLRLYNKMWYYNGHVPITGMIAFIAYAYSFLFWYSSIILSNEKSADEENTTWEDININHQYSKWWEFEKDFKDYSKNFLPWDIQYFSLLRWMYEYKIASIFAKQKWFHTIFSSCNHNFKIYNQSQDCLWCNNCSKCAFVFLILSSFLDISELESIFWENLFHKKELIGVFGELIGEQNHKPFECVGTHDESRMSMYKAIQKYEQNSFFVLETYKQFILDHFSLYDPEKEEEKLLKIYEDDIIPSSFKNLLKNI